MEDIDACSVFSTVLAQFRWLYQKIPCYNTCCVVSVIFIHRRMTYPVRV